MRLNHKNSFFKRVSLSSFFFLSLFFSSSAKGISCTEKSLAVTSFNLRYDPKVVFTEFVEKIPDQIARNKALKIFEIAQKRNFDTDDFTETLWTNIAFGKLGKLLQVSFKDNLRLSGSMGFENNTLSVEIFEIWDFKATKIGNVRMNKGFSMTLPRVIYGTLKGASTRAILNVDITRVEIRAGMVINAMLKKMFTEFGFVEKNTLVSLTPEQIETGGYTLVLPLKVR